MRIVIPHSNAQTIAHADNSFTVHREDGPAWEEASGYKAWYYNGVKHREDGPAVEHPTGNLEWWEHGKLLGKS